MRALILLSARKRPPVTMTDHHDHDDDHHHDDDGDHDQHFNCGGMIQDDFWRLSTKAGIFETMSL